MTGSADPSPLAFTPHDHAHCCGDVLLRAETVAQERGVRLTPVRRRVLEILLESHRAMGAYDVLERLSGDGFGNQPPVAYRALEFLEEQGLAHRIRRLNAFAACMHPGEEHSPAFFICRLCKLVADERLRWQEQRLGHKGGVGLPALQQGLGRSDHIGMALGPEFRGSDVSRDRTVAVLNCFRRE